MNTPSTTPEDIAEAGYQIIKADGQPLPNSDGFHLKQPGYYWSARNWVEDNGPHASPDDAIDACRDYLATLDA